MFEKKKWYSKALTPASTLATLIIGGGLVGLAAVVDENLKNRKRERKEFVDDKIAWLTNHLRDKLDHIDGHVRAVDDKVQRLADEKCTCDRNKKG